MGIVGRINRVSAILLNEQVELFRRHGLDFPSFDVLATLRRSEPPHTLTPGQLTDQTMVTSGAISQRLDRLERQGLIVRRRNADDRRSVMVALTPTGRDLIDRALPDHVANESRLLASLTAEERETLARTLATLLEALGG